MKENLISRVPETAKDSFFPTMIFLTTTLAAITYMERNVPVSVTFLTAAALSIIGEIITLKSRRH